MPAYNELMAEQVAVLFAKADTAASGSNMLLYPSGDAINVAMMNRIIIDINLAAASTLTLTVKYCPTNKGTYSTGGISLLPSSIVAGAAGLFRLEYSEDYIRDSIIGASTGHVAGVTASDVPGAWLQFTLASTATVVKAAVIYGQATYYPSADNIINKFQTSLTAANGGCPVAQQYVDGVVGATPATFNPSAPTKLVLPI